MHDHDTIARNGITEAVKYVERNGISAVYTNMVFLKGDEPDEGIDEGLNQSYCEISTKFLHSL